MPESRIKISLGSQADLTGFQKVKSAISNTASKIKEFAGKVGTNLMNIKAGFDMAIGAVRTFGSVLKKALDAQTMTVQFKTLLGSMDEAKSHMEMLREMGATPPFSMEEFAEASRKMMVMSDGALGLRGTLQMVGDAAAATGQPIEQVGEAVAKAYALIRDGEPVSRAATQLRNMGLITPEVAANLQELQKSGADNIAIWDKLQEALGKFSGAMAETEQTGNGMISAIEAQWDEGLRDFGKALLDVGEVYIKDFLGWLREIRDDGSLQDFIDNFANFVSYIVSGLKKCIGWFSKFKEMATEGLGYAGDMIGAMMAGKSFGEAMDIATQTALQDKMNKLRLEQVKAEERIAEQNRKNLEIEKQRTAEKEKQADQLKSHVREAEKGNKIENETSAGTAGGTSSGGGLFGFITKKIAQQIPSIVKGVRDIVQKGIDAEIKDAQKFKADYDATVNRGISAEISRNGKTRVRLDPETGLPVSVADFERAERFERHGTKEGNSAARRAARDEKRASAIEEQLARGGIISGRDEKFLKNFKNLQARREADRKISDLNKRKDEAVLKINDNVAKIATNMGL